MKPGDKVLLTNVGYQAIKRANAHHSYMLPKWIKPGAEGIVLDCPCCKEGEYEVLFGITRIICDRPMVILKPKIKTIDGYYEINCKFFGSLSYAMNYAVMVML